MTLARTTTTAPHYDPPSSSLVQLFLFSVILASITLRFALVTIYVGPYFPASIAFGLTVPYHLACIVSAQSSKYNIPLLRLSPFTLASVIVSSSLSVAWLATFVVGILGCIVTRVYSPPITIMTVFAGMQCIVMVSITMHCAHERVRLKVDAPGNLSEDGKVQPAIAPAIQGRAFAHLFLRSLTLPLSISIGLAIWTFAFASIRIYLVGTYVPNPLAFGLTVSYHIALLVTARRQTLASFESMSHMSSPGTGVGGIAYSIFLTMLWAVAFSSNVLVCIITEGRDFTVVISTASAGLLCLLTGYLATECVRETYRYGDLS